MMEQIYLIRMIFVNPAGWIETETQFTENYVLT